MRIPSGSTDRYVYFVAVDETDLATRETGLSSFSVYRSRDGGAAAAFTTPTINETDATNMPGVYELLVDEDTTIGAGHDSEEMALHITHAGMAPVTRVVELYRPKITEGSTDLLQADWADGGRLDTILDTAAAGAGNVSTVIVGQSNTFHVRKGLGGLVTDSIITLQPSSIETLAVDFTDVLNPGTAFASVTSVTESSGASPAPTVTDELLSQDRQKIHFTVEDITDDISYTFEVIAVTTDGQTRVVDVRVDGEETP